MPMSVSPDIEPRQGLHERQITFLKGVFGPETLPVIDSLDLPAAQELTTAVGELFVSLPRLKISEQTRQLRQDQMAAFMRSHEVDMDSLGAEFDVSANGLRCILKDAARTVHRKVPATQLYDLLDSQVNATILEKSLTAPVTETPRNNSSNRTTRGNYQSASKGDRDDPVVRHYLADIGRHPLLTKADEQELGRKIEAGRTALEALEAGAIKGPKALRTAQQAITEAAAARDTMINSNLRLVVSIAKKYPTTPSHGFMDNIQEGNLGMEHAVDKFDYRKGFKFSTYATWWIRQAIVRGLADNGNTIRIPIHRMEQYSAARRAIGNVPDAQLPPEEEEIARMLDHDSLDRQLDERGRSSVSDVTPDASAIDPEQAVISNELRSRIDHAMSNLSHPQAQLIRDGLYYVFGLTDGDPHSALEASKYLGVYYDRMRRLINQGLEELRSSEELEALAV